MSGITTEFDEEAESAIENAPKALKRYLAFFSKCCLGQKVAPKEAFGAKNSGIDAEFREESESAIESFPKSLKLEILKI